MKIKLQLLLLCSFLTAQLFAQVTAPSNLTATYDNVDNFGNIGHYVELRWDNNEESDGNYLIERSQNNQSNFQMIASEPSSFTLDQTYFDGELGSEIEPGTYFYRVRKEDNSSGVSEYSDYSNVVEVQTIANLISFNIDTINFEGQDTPDERLVLNINYATAPDGSFYDVEGIIVEKSINNTNNFVEIHDEEIDLASMINTFDDYSFLESNTTYYYRIGSYYRSNGIDTLIYGETKSIFYSDGGKPSELEATLLPNKEVSLTWKDNSDNETQFIIERRYFTNGVEQEVFRDSVGSNIESYLDNGNLVHGIIYEYKVYADTPDGLMESVFSTSVKVQQTPLADPTNLVAVATSHSQIDLTWEDNSDNEEYFLLIRARGLSSTDYDIVDSIPANTTSYSDVGLSQNSNYKYYLSARADSSASSVALMPPPKQKFLFP